MTKPALSSMMALLFWSLPQWNFGQIQQFDYLIDNITLTPNFEGETFQLHLREKVSQDLLDDPNTDFSEKVVLMIHGNSVPATAVFDLAYQDYSWMEALAAEGYDVFALSLTGYGSSTRPAAHAGFLQHRFSGSLGQQHLLPLCQLPLSDDEQRQRDG